MKQKQSKLMPILINILILIIGFAGGYSINYAINQPKKENKIEGQSAISKVKVVEKTNLEQNLIKQIIKKIKPEFKLTFDGGIKKMKNKNLYLAVDGLGFYKNYKQDEDLEKEVDLIKESLEKEKFKLLETIEKYENHNYFYQNNKLHCSLSTSYQKGVESSKHISLGCVDLENFKKDEQLALKITKEKKELPKEAKVMMSISKENITDGATKGYKILQSGGADLLEPFGHYQMYYQTPSGEWHKSFGGNGLPSCDDFKNEDELKTFFKEEKCIPDEAGQATNLITQQ